jgi:small-conductance mechanosensitive channel
LASLNVDKFSVPRDNRLFASVFILTALAVAPIAAQQAGVYVAAADVVHHLEQSIAWYHTVDGTASLEGISNEVVLNNSVHQTALRAVQAGFDFARADAALIAARGQQTQQAQPTGGRNLEQAQERAATRISNIQSRITALDASLPRPGAKQRPLLEAQRRELEAELNLAQQVQQTIQGVVSAAGVPSAGGLAGQISDLERSIPEALRNAGAGTAAANQTAGGASASTPASNARPANTPAFRPQSAGLLALVSELIALNKTESQVKTAVAATDSISDEINKLKLPLTSAVRSAVQLSEQLTGAATNETVEQIASDQRRIDALTGEFRRLSTALVPLSQQQILIASVRGNLDELRTAARAQTNDTARSLFIRSAMIAGGIIVLLTISAVWRRATFRYIQDLRRRRQLTIVRRVVIGVLMALIVVLGVISDFGSLATYAGFLTAGIAVALQNVLLAVVAYFFFIGRYGVRVGDLVTISGVTGNVVEIGLVRLYMMELAGAAPELHPTGRIVVLSNSVLFQPAPLFKQMPGANYVWHKVTATLGADTDIETARAALTAAVESVLAEDRAEIERQHAALERSVDIQVKKPNPDYHFRYTDAGLEFTAQYPAEFQKSAATDDKVIRAVYKAISDNSQLHLAAGGGPKVS